MKLKAFLRALKDDDCKGLDGRKLKKPRIRFATARAELVVLSVYSDGRDIWVDLETKPVRRKT